MSKLQEYIKIKNNIFIYDESSIIIIYTNCLRLDLKNKRVIILYE